MRFTKFKSVACLAASVAMLISVISPVSANTAVDKSASASVAADKLAAFPGAEGGGMWANGARAGENVEVYHVTKLTDDGSKGTFRDAVSEPNRVVIFDVAGNIALSDTLTIKADNLTILGQTAPGDGICLKDCNVAVTGDNVIMRYLRFRMGDAKTIEEDTLNNGGEINNVIIDHCSISFSVDECASFYDKNTNFTMQWCIISESLKESIHGKGSHGYGGIWGGTNASFHHNLLAHHDSRNPRIAEGSVTGSEYDMSAQTDLTDLRNNVIYNWGGNSAYGGQAGMPVNIINCYYKPGPATKSGVKDRIYELTSSGNGITYEWSSDLYVDGNYVDGSETVTADNSKGVDNDGGSKYWYIWTKDTIAESADAQNVHFKYEKEYPVTTQSAQEAYESVLAGAGASVVRDSIDTRIIEEVKNGTAQYGTNGLINTPSDVGGYPELTGTKAKDSDNDGIPNEWEDKNGLDKMNGADGITLAPSGYLYVEEYANALADGSYVRDVAYDPDVEDYIPSDDPDASDDPNATDTPKVELVSSWTAASGDETKAAGTELMPGLKNVIQLSRPMTNEKTFADGFTHNFAITHKDINGGWDAENGVATGSALEFTAPEDGVFTLYSYGVSVKNPPTMFYAVPKGATDPATENVFAEPIDEANKPVLCSIPVKAGEVYYFYIAGGSKARFMAAKFEKYVTEPSLELVSSWTATSGDETKAAGSELMPGLKNVIQLSRPMTNEKTFADGFTHNFAITHKDINGGWDAENGVATGSALEFTAPEDGVFTLYSYGVSVKNPPTMFYAVPKGATDPATENVFAEPIDEANKPVLCSIPVKAGEVYYFYIAGGSKARFMAAKFEKYVTASDEFTVDSYSINETQITVNVTKNSEMDSDSIIIAAYYDEDGILKDVSTVAIPKDMAVGGFESYTINRGRADGEKVKIFIWGSENSAKPLAKVTDVN